MLTRIPYKTKMLPIKLSLIYLFGTYAIFLTSSLASQVNSIYLESIFVISAFILFYFGYWFGVNTKKDICFNDIVSLKKLRYAKRIIMLGSIYFFVWGVNQISDFGGASTLIYNITHPGEAYSQKFDVYAMRESTGAVNHITQVLLLLSYIYSVFIIALIFYWGRLSLIVKFLAIFSILVYVISFVFIGTQKGIGDVILFAIAGVAIWMGAKPNLDKRIKKRIWVSVSVIMLVVIGYMSVVQSSRADQFGQTDSLLFGDVSKTWLAELTDPQTALGIYTIISYPTHGYAGLAHNLDQDFVFSNGAGISPALDSYLLQYVGSSSFPQTYPARTEVATGWPAGMYWATAFPWFASDLSFPGTVALMFFVGFLFARAWISSISKHDILSFAIFGQLTMFVLFLPANNQVLMNRQGLWVVISIVFIQLLRLLKRAA